LNAFQPSLPIHQSQSRKCIVAGDAKVGDFIFEGKPACLISFPKLTTSGTSVEKVVRGWFSEVVPWVHRGKAYNKFRGRDQSQGDLRQPGWESQSEAVFFLPRPPLDQSDSIFYVLLNCPAFLQENNGCWGKSFFAKNPRAKKICFKQVLF